MEDYIKHSKTPTDKNESHAIDAELLDFFRLEIKSVLDEFRKHLCSLKIDGDQVFVKNNVTFDIPGKVLKKITDASADSAPKTVVLSPEDVKKINNNKAYLSEDSLNKLDNLIKGIEKSVTSTFNSFSKALNDKFSDDPKKYLSVRLSDGEKFYKAMSQFIQSARAVANTLPEGSSTSVKQDSIITLLGEIKGFVDGIETELANLEITGTVTAQENSGTIYINGVAHTLKRAFVNVAVSQTDSNIVTAVTDKKIRVISGYAVCGAVATDLTFNSKGAGAGTAISPLIANGLNGGEILPRNVDGWFETATGEALTCTTGAGSSTGIQVNYIEV